jgi:hypothetical protein
MGTFLRWKVAESTVLLLLVATAGWVTSVDPPPSGPALYNTEHWIPLAHTDDPTFAAGGVKPMPPVSESWKDPSALIFVGIAHYRDRRCSTTLSNIFANAKHPERIRVGKTCQHFTCWFLPPVLILLS